MELTKKDAAVFTLVAVSLLAFIVEGTDKVLLIGKEVTNCPGLTLPMSLTDIKITYSKKGTVTHARATLNVEKDTAGKKFSLMVYKNGVVKSIIYQTKFDDLCKEVKRTDNFYLNKLFRSGEIPRTCKFTKGKYPFQINLNDTLTVPMMPPMLKGEVHLEVQASDVDEKPFFCCNARIVIKVM